jgi:protein OPY2
MAVFNAQVFPPFVTVDLLRSVFKLHSMCLDFISSTRVFTSTFRSCSQCSTSRCEDQPASPNSGHGVSAGVVAGAVVGSIVFLALSVSLFLWWRRRNAAALQPSVQVVKDMPAPADTVLNRPDPTEKVVVTPPTVNPVPNESVVRVYGNSNATINLDPTSQSSPARSDSSHSNPFGDNHSIQTTSTGSQSTNVIPIAFVPPPASVLPTGSLPQASSTSLVHNSRAPRVELNMDHMNLSVESVPLNSASPSGVSTIPDDHSYITNASYASDVLSEVPTIVTGRQVASAAKAAVVSASSARSLASRPSTRSPLTASSFGPQDILHEADEIPVPLNPFADQRPSVVGSSMPTRGSTQPPQDLGTAGDQHPWNADSGVNDSDRPSSMYTQAASVIGADIMDATRVHLGFAQPASGSVYHATPLASSVMGGSTSLVRMASGRLVSNPLQYQQESSLATMQAQAQQSEKVQAIPQRISMSTMASGVSGRADSILESFTFVPPSPISNRPLRTPPRSPLVQETHHVQDPPAPVQDDGVLEPPNRQVLGMSTGSQLSSMSTGLGSFPFQIDHGSEGNQTEDLAGVPLSGQFIDKDEMRASLDTLALTRDLTSSYPSGFNRQPKESYTTLAENKR